MFFAAWLDRTEKLAPTTDEEDVAVTTDALLRLLNSTSRKNFAAEGCADCEICALNLREIEWK